MANTQPARVTYGMRIVRNLGDFETMAVEISIEDSPRGDERVVDAYERVKSFVERKISDKNDEIEAIMGGE